MNAERSLKPSALSMKSSKFTRQREEANPESGDFDLIRYWEVSVSPVSGLMYYLCKPQLFPESVFFLQ
jgi:hypothetical protein